jgi:hypothetical protein
VLAAGNAYAVTARQAAVSVDTVHKWRRRFVTDRLGGLRDTNTRGVRDGCRTPSVHR